MPQIQEQDMHLDKIRADLEQAEEAWRDANENELPEEYYRLVTERKRKELADLMAKYHQENEAKRCATTSRLPPQDSTASSQAVGHSHPHFERPSERRRRLELERAERERSAGRGTGSRYSTNDDAFASFGGRYRR